MKKLVSLIGATAIGLVCLAPAASAQTFPDVDANHTYAAEIQYVKNNDIVHGFTDGEYRPDQLINRAEFTKIAIRSRFPASEINNCVSETYNNAGNIFPDIPWNHPHASSICIAKKHNIISGYSDGTYKPDNKIEFSQALKIFMRTLDEEITFPVDANLQVYMNRLVEKNAQPPTVTQGDASKHINRGETAFLAQIIRDDYVRLSNTNTVAYVSFENTEFSMRFPIDWKPEASTGTAFEMFYTSGDESENIIVEHSPDFNSFVVNQDSCNNALNLYKNLLDATNAFDSVTKVSANVVTIDGIQSCKLRFSNVFESETFKQDVYLIPTSNTVFAIVTTGSDYVSQGIVETFNLK